MNVVGVCGTHHQPFDRLVRALDALAGAPGFTVWVQYGAARPPVRAEGAPFVEREELRRRVGAADVVVTHGGPGAIWDALDAGRATLVVPRMHRYREHVDDHQVAFARHLAAHGLVAVAEDLDRLADLVSKAAAAGPHVQPASRSEAAVQRIGVLLDELVAARSRR